MRSTKLSNKPRSAQSLGEASPASHLVACRLERQLGLAANQIVQEFSTPRRRRHLAPRAATSSPKTATCATLSRFCSTIGNLSKNRDDGRMAGLVAPRQKSRRLPPRPRRRPARVHGPRSHLEKCIEENRPSAPGSLLASSKSDENCGMTCIKKNSKTAIAETIRKAG